MKTKIPNLSPGSTVLVTGATGFTGSHLMKKLLKQNVRVRAICRPSSDRSLFAGMPVEWIVGDIRGEASVKEAVRGVSYIFHLATLFRYPSATEEEQWQVHVLGTKLLAKAALEEKNLKRFVHVSTVGVLGHIKNPPADENTPYGPADAYQRTKAEAERWMLDFSKESGLPLTVIRPSSLYGPGDRRLLKLFKMIHRGRVPLIRRGRALFHLCHVDDVTDFMLLCAEHPKAEGEVFICAGPLALPHIKIMKIIAAAFGVRLKFINLPEHLTFMAADLCEAMCRPLKLRPPLYRRRVAFYTHDRSFDCRKMKTVLGFVPRHDLRSGLEETAKWYLNHGWLQDVPRSTFNVSLKGVNS